MPADNSDRIGLKELFAFLALALRPVKKPLIPLLTGLFLINFYHLVPSLVLGKTVDALADTSVPLEDRYRTLFIYAASLALSWFVVSSVRLTIRKKITFLRTTVGYCLRTKTLEEVIFTEQKTRESSGAIVQRVSAGVADLYDFSRLVMNNLFPLTTGILGAFLVVLWIEWRLAGLFLVYGLGTALQLRYFTGKIQLLLVDIAKANERAAGALSDTASKTDVVTSEGAEASFTSFITNKFESVRESELVYNHLSIFQWRVYQTWNGLFAGSALLLGGMEVLAGNMAPGALVIFAGYTREVTDRCTDLLNNWEKLQANVASLSRFSRLFGHGEARKSGVRTLSGDWKKISAAAITFSYRATNTGNVRVENAPVLKDFSFEINKGEVVRLVGPSGSGKTTLAKLIVGLLAPTAGEIKIDGVNISEFDSSSLRGQLALALQDAQLLNLSLLENITLLREVESSKLKQILDLCEVTEIASRLPNGFETLIGETAAKLSGGERQRVALARALCREPSLVILDESTAMLDSEREQRIVQRLLSNYPGLTLVLISHHGRLNQIVGREIALGERPEA